MREGVSSSSAIPTAASIQPLLKDTPNKGHNNYYTLEGPESSLSYDVSLASKDTDKIAGLKMSDFTSLRLFAIVPPPPPPLPTTGLASKIKRTGG